MPLTPARQEAEVRRLWSWVRSGQKYHETLFENENKPKGLEV
jgi:hypothetical protein